jgi:ribosome recycling factor
MHQFIEERKEDTEKLKTHLKKELASLRTGHASPALVEHVLIEVYGVKTPLPQLASLAVPEPQTVTIDPWDKSIIKAIEKGIIAANIGVSPVVDGERIRLNIPPLTEETRKARAKEVGEKVEDARIALRKIRDEIKDAIRKAEKVGEMSEDDRYRAEREMDEWTKKTQQTLESLGANKEKELLDMSRA